MAGIMSQLLSQLAEIPYIAKLRATPTPRMTTKTSFANELPGLMGGTSAMSDTVSDFANGYR